MLTTKMKEIAVVKTQQHQHLSFVLTTIAPVSKAKVAHPLFLRL